MKLRAAEAIILWPGKRSLKHNNREGENMNVKELIEALQGLDPDTPVRIDCCLNTPNGQVFWSEELDHVSKPHIGGRNDGATVLCNWDSPAVNLCDLTPID